MNIGMVLDNEFFGDMRVENEVISLTEAGFNVSVVCFDHKKGEDHIAEYHGAKIIKIHLDLWRKKKMKGLTNFIIDPYTWYWSKQIVKFVKENNIDVLHVHDLFLLGAALNANKRLSNRCKIVSDLHENYPAALRHYRFANTFPGNILISVPKWERTEKKWTKKADYIITVIEEAVTRYKKLGVKNISVVANYVNRDLFTSAPDSEDLKNRFKDNFSALYVGGFDHHRGLESAVEAVPAIIQQIPNFKLILVGKGINLGELQERAKALNISDHVAFEGWQSPTLLPSYIKASDICLIPHLKTEHTDHTIPHKLFQYMLLKRPVLATNCNPIERIIRETQSGEIYASNDSKSFTEKIITLYNDPELRDKMGINGNRAVQENYNWEMTAKNLISLYKEIETSYFSS